ncbi:MAG: 3-deoxy-D-manno-octulosonic acid transferase [Verrucomicrobiae bacterium]|nr:3-deoxy-D-manno-octulosonic acid transferase [Verrucomicrobiae bacterium]
MRTVYNVVFPILFLLSAPWYLLKMWRRGNWREGLGERFGRYTSSVKHAVTNRRVIWFHAVSVGEVNLCARLIRAFEPRVPTAKIVVSTTTSTGMEQLRKQLPPHILKIYFPLDFPRVVSRALAVIHPEMVILVEAEIWPNFLWKLRDRHIPVFLVNARLSERSYRGYKRLWFLFRPLFASFRGVGAQNERDAQRLVELGCRAEAVRVVGSMKFDAARFEAGEQLDVQTLLHQIGVPASADLLVGGSTHAGEEALLAEAYKALKPKYPNLFLVLVPRHFERGKQVGRELAERGLRFVYRREITSATRLPPGSVDCLLVNTTGELLSFYQCATVVFVGKSLTADGGQNPIEPGALGKAMIFGPNMQNFAAVAENFVKHNAAVQIRSASELVPAIDALLQDPARREELGRNAIRVVKSSSGAVERTIDMVISYMERKENLSTLLRPEIFAPTPSTTSPPEQNSFPPRPHDATPLV